MKKYLEILKGRIPGISQHGLNVPINDAGMRSPDTIIVRETSENYFDAETDDMDWYELNTSHETIGHLPGKNKTVDKLSDLEKPGVLYREHEIRIPQMANSALSENWLLKEMGDIHWELLSRGLEQKSSEFADCNGNRLYAAFVRVKYAMGPLDHFLENETLHMKGAIKRAGDYTYYSNIKGQCNGQHLNANLMSSFSARKANDNKQIAKGKPVKNGSNLIEELEQTPDFYNEHRLLKKGIINEISSGGRQFKFTDTVVASVRHTINPYYEINGVGLLYFAAYPMIADECTAAFLKTTGIEDYGSSYHTTFRDIFYFANCNANDVIKADLNTIEHLEGNQLKTTTSLYRDGDNTLMAKIITIKQKTVL